MTRMARILLVQPPEELRQDLNQRLEGAGHEVAYADDLDEARCLLQEGLSPDVVVAEAPGDNRQQGALRKLAPRAAHLRIVANAEPRRAFSDLDDETTECGPDVGELLRCLEEVLLAHPPDRSADPAGLCLELARRLANSVPHTTSTDERIELVTEGFASFFGVVGSLVVRQGPHEQDWIEVSQGLDHEVAAAISDEIARRSRYRSIRPFLAQISVGDESIDVACVAIANGETETDLALVLETAPQDTQLRESLMNLVGSALRAGMAAKELERTQRLLEAHRESFSSLLEMSRELSQLGGRRLLGQRILALLNRELGIARSAIFVPRDDQGMLDLLETAGFPTMMLERIGLSGFHGVGAAALDGDEVVKLTEISSDGAASRELEILNKAGLRWAVPIRLDDRAFGLLFLGGRDDQPRLPDGDLHVLKALQEATAVALRNMDRMEETQDLAVRMLRGLATVSELGRPEQRGHAERVAHHSALMGRALGLPARDLRELVCAAMLHDVGQVSSCGASPERDGESRLHPVAGSRILSGAQPSKAIVQSVEQHHERVDGCGYPYGLRSADIHVFARIIAVADWYDQQVNEQGRSPDEAIASLERGAGLQWDAGIVALFASEVGRHPNGSAIEPGWLDEVICAS